MHGRIAIAVLAIFAGGQVFAPSAAKAQDRSNTSRLFVGLAVGGASIDSDDLDVERQFGGGAALRLGYGFTSLFSLYVEGAGASVEEDDDTFVLAHGDIGARLHFGGPARAVIPFLDVAFSSRAIAVDDYEFVDDQGNPATGDVEVSGSGFSFGGGVLFFFNRNWALDVGLKFTSGEFDTVKFNNISVSDLIEVDATSARLKIGVTWFPMSAR